MISSRIVAVPKVVYMAVCDDCGIEGPGANSGYKAAQLAKRQGWRWVGEDCYCPDHAESPRIREKAAGELWRSVQEFSEKQTALCLGGLLFGYS